MSLLAIRNLTVEYLQGKKALAAVRGVSLDIAEGKTVALVGESGCGKSTLALAIVRLLPALDSRISSGEIKFADQDLARADTETVRNIRGRKIGVVFQDPFSALNPVLRVGYQLEETIELDQRDDVRGRAIELLRQVQLSEPERILNSYPHQLSGGQRQRVMIAIALARRPQLLIADEPTTALDVTVQDEIIKLLVQLKAQLKMSMLFVTHNLGLVRTLADDVAVMYAGQIIERGSARDVLTAPKHPYTQGLLRSQVTLTPGGGAIPVLEGQPPQPHQIPSGCPFHPRCPNCFDPCPTADPVDRSAGNQTVRCHLYPC